MPDDLDFKFDFDEDDNVPVPDNDGPDNAGVHPPAVDSAETHGDSTVDSPAPIPAPDIPSLVEVDFDAEFAAIVGDFSNDEEVIKAAEDLIAVQELLDGAEEEKERLNLEEEVARKERHELEQQMVAIREKIQEKSKREAEIAAATWDLRLKQRNAEKIVAEKRRAIEVAKDAVMLRKRHEEQALELERFAEQFAWKTGLDNGMKIFPHQFEGAKFIATAKRMILGDGMGLGKTLTAIASLDLWKSKRALVIAPSDVTSNFLEEIHEWAGHRVVINLRGMPKAQRNITLETMTAALPEFIVVVNYEAWRKDHSLITRLSNVAFDSIICDESHVMKDITSDAYRGVQEIITCNNICPVCPSAPFMPTVGEGIGINKFRKCEACGWSGESFYSVDEAGNEREFQEKAALSKSVQNVLLMTGTLILNSAVDLFAPLSLIDPFNFPKKNEYLRNYCWQDTYTGRWSFRSGGLDRLTQHTLKGKFLARTMEDAGIILPPMKPIKHEVELLAEEYPAQRRVVDQLRKHSQIILGDGRTLSAMEAIALITRERQANVFPGGIQVRDPETKEVIMSVGDDVKESVKIDKAIEIITTQVNDGQRVALFSQFSGALEEIQRRLNQITFEDGRKVRSVLMTGAQTQDIKDQIKTNFDRKRNEEVKWDVVLCNYKTGGVGLNFTAATHSIILDREWNPGKEDQAIARIYRIGQTERTFIHTIEVKGSIDIWLNGLHDEKADMIGGFTSTTRDMQVEYLQALKDGTIS